MKSASNEHPKVFENIGNGKYYYNYNIVEHMDKETKEVSYTYDQLKIKGVPDYGNIINGLIRERYSISEEIALIRQHETKQIEYNAYYDFCEAIKKQVKKDLNEFTE